MRFDVIVIGAGVAGIAAARALSGAGKQVCIIEARQRLGGRVLTIHDHASPLPIELGAEFIHGSAPDTFAIVDAASLLAYQLPDNHWWSRDGRWQLIDDFWQRIDRVRARIGEGPDRSFADFLKAQRSLPPKIRELALNFVEGYHAAHAERLSAKSLKFADGEQQDPSGHKQFRIGSGYDTLVAWLQAGLDPDHCSIRLGTLAEHVEWRAGDVTVRTSRGEELRADSLLVTIPLGVLKAPAGQPGSIVFTPALRTKERALATLEIGHIVKIVFTFRERFWDDDDFVSERSSSKRTRPNESLNFIHSNDPHVPTWWTSAPVRSCSLTAWAGGHAADRLLAERPNSRIDRALESLSSVFAIERKTIDDLLASSHTHDWQADPFSRGAYSYAAVGGTRGHATLAKPVESTIFFAGEATNGEETGTVSGAIASGKRAAREILASGVLG
jgi:monoamine oxidase